MRMFTTAFYMLLSILGLSVISLGGLIGVQMYRGKLSARDLHSIMRVIGGVDRIMIPNADYEAYVDFAKDKEKARAELESNRGLPETRVPAAMRAQEIQTMQREDLAVVNRLLETQKSALEALRSEVDAQKLQVQNLTRALNDEKMKNAIVAKDEATQKLRKTLAEMDAGNVATFLANIIRDPSQGGPVEAARIIREYLKADYSAEVLGEMPVQERQRVIPLLENQFAGVPPEVVVKIFADQKMSPGEQLVYLMQMNPQQALGVFLRLPPAAQEQIAPQVLRMQQGA